MSKLEDTATGSSAPAIEYDSTQKRDQNDAEELLIASAGM